MAIKQYSLKKDGSRKQAEQAALDKEAGNV